MSTNTPTRQSCRPELALRMRKSAAILTRAACLLASDGRTMSGTAARYHTMTGLIQRVREEVFPDRLAAARKEQWIRKERVLDDKQRRIPKKARQEAHLDEAAWAWAYALIPQDPVDQSPEVGELIRAARTLKRMAEQAEHTLPTAAEIRAVEKRIRALVPVPDYHQSRVSIELGTKGFNVWVMMYFGVSHELIQADSLEGLVTAAERMTASHGLRVLGKEAA